MRLTVWLTGITLLLLTGMAWGQPIGAGFDSLDWMVADSEVVAIGHITSIKNDDASDGIFSKWDTITLEVEQILKGPNSKELTFRAQPEYFSTRHQVYISKDEEVMVFLADSARHYSRSASQFRYAVRSRSPKENFIHLGDTAHPFAINAKLEAVTDPKSLLEQVHTAVVKYTEGRFTAVDLKPKFAQVPKFFQKGGFGWVTVMVPKHAPPAGAWLREQANRFGSDMDYDGGRFTRADKDVVKVWNTENGNVIRTFPVTTGCPTSVALSPDGTNMLVGTDGKTPEIIQFNIDTGAMEMSRSIGGKVEQLAYAPVGDTYASMSIENFGSTPRRLRLRSTFDGQDMMMFPGASLRFSNDSTMVLTNGEQWGLWVGVWDTKTFLQQSLIQGEEVEGKEFFSAEFSPYGNRIVTTCVSHPAGGYESSVEVWDALTGKPIWKTVGKRLRKAVYSHDGSRVIAGSKASAIGVYDAENGSLLRNFPCPGNILDILVSRDGTRCLANWGDGNRDYQVNGTSLFDLASGKELCRVERSEAAIVGFSRDAKTFLGIRRRSDGKDAAVTYNSLTGGIIHSLPLNGS